MSVQKLRTIMVQNILVFCIFQIVCYVFRAPMAYDIIVRKKRIKVFIMWSAVALLTFLVSIYC